MAGFLERRLWLTVGGGLVVAAVAVGWALLVARGGHRPAGPPPASVGGLVVQTGASPQDLEPDQRKPLRCFVNGQFVGLETVADCAARNGVATDTLDVGAGGAVQAPPIQAQTGAPPAAPQPASAVSAEIDAGAPARPTGECWRYAGEWRRAGDGLTLAACARLLFDGRCEAPGEAGYGRWMGQTLRLEARQVAISSDNKTFHPLVQQSDAGCALADF